MNLATVIVLLVIAALVIVAIRALRTNKDSCSCGGNAKKDNCSSCTHCSANCPLKKAYKKGTHSKNGMSTC